MPKRIAAEVPSNGMGLVSRPTWLSDTSSLAHEVVDDLALGRYAGAFQFSINLIDLESTHDETVCST
jgi:hypothetical protein